jgi:hypothetical protein
MLFEIAFLRSGYSHEKLEPTDPLMTTARGFAATVGSRLTDRRPTHVEAVSTERTGSALEGKTEGL